MTLIGDSATRLSDSHSLSVRQPAILAVDDEAMVLDLVTIWLQRQGYAVLSASDGQQGLELSRTFPGTIDLVITDVVMPRLNGIDLCARLLRERPGIRAIVMSAAHNHKIVTQSNFLFLAKPFDRKALLEKVRVILGAAA